ncbi:MAG TPA: MarR family transcriptional regulator, partial [Candidatus Thermoplasmatota archaeon]|nr:MarR family transcriptional regulator [Candidatus Thermoplasmatota archaeon]
ALDGVGVHVDLRPEDGGAQSSSPVVEGGRAVVASAVSGVVPEPRAAGSNEAALVATYAPADEPDGANRAAKAYGLSGPGPASAVGPQSGVMAALLLGVALAIPLWALYRRLVREGALDQERRRRIHDLVLASPGITAGELRSATGLHYTTVTHHLRVLHELGLVEVLRLDGRLRAFENHGRFGCVEKRVAAAAKSATSLAVLTVALRRPGVSPSTVATELGLTRPAVKRHVDKLAAWGLLEPRREGARLRLHLSPRAVDAVLARQPSVRAP